MSNVLTKPRKVNTKTELAASTEIKTAGNEKLVTFEQFYKTVDESVHADLLDGKIIRDSPAVPRHSRTVNFLDRLLGTYVEHRRLGEVFGSTSTVRLTVYQAPEPDLFFISSSRRHIIIDDKYVDGPPDLCIEVISKTSHKRDRNRKFVLYADHGVREYWIIDPLLFVADFYRNVEGEWQEIPVDEQGIFHSEVVPGFWMKVEWLFADPLPDVYELLKLVLGE